MDKTKPLIMIIESAKTETSNAVSMIQRKYGLPAYLMEGIVTSILSEIRDAKSQEMSIAWKEKNENRREEETENADADKIDDEHQPGNDG